MHFEWDDSKSETCFRQRGFDFAYAARAFFDPNRLVQADNRRCYGEDRYQLMSMIQQRLFVVVYTPRKANQREINRYENSTLDH